MLLLTLASVSWAAELNYCAGVQTADDKRIYWTTYQSCKTNRYYPGSLKWWSIKTISASDYEKVMDWAESSTTTDQNAPIKFCAAINALDGNAIYWTTHQTCEHYNNDILASLEWWSINQITESDYARVVRSAPSFTTSSTVTTFTGYCFRSKDEYFYQSSYLGKCVGSDRNITKQEFDNRHLPSNTTASPRHYLLQVTSNISRAEIWIDGEYRGLTPGFNIKVDRAWNTVVVKRSGYENYSTTVNAATGQHVFANLKKRISLSTTASSSRKYCYRASPVRFYTPTDRICKSGDREITRKEYDNRKIVSTIGGNDERKRVSTAARSYSNNILGYCYDPPAQLFYIKDAAECAGSDLEITKQEFKNKTVVSATFRFLDSHWYRAHCLGNVEFPCRFTYGIKTHGNRRIVIQTKQGEIIFPDGSTYIGPFDRGIWHGHGTYIFSDKRKYTYTGQFKNGRAHGRGVLVLSNGVRFDGLFRNGKKWWGTEFDKRGKIVASFSNGKRHPKLY